MTRAVYKYPLEMLDTQEIELPHGAKLLHVDEQRVGDGGLQLWALVDPSDNAPKTTRRIRIAGTGHQIRGEHLEFVGTVLTNGGALVWHVFAEDA